jgi:hypothetical protein
VVPFVLLECVARRAWWSPSTLSLLQLAAMAVPLVALPWANRLRLGVVVSAGLLAVGLAWLISPASFAWAAALVTARDAFLGNVAEVKPLFVAGSGLSLRPMHLAFGFGFLSVPLLLVVARRTRTLDLERWTWTLVLFTLSLSQKRFGHLFAPAYVLLVFAAVSAVRAPVWRAVVAGVALTLLVEPAWTFRGDLASPVSESTEVAWEIADALQGHTRPGEAIAAPPNYGNALLWRTGLPIVTNTFFYRRYLARDLQVRSFERAEDLRAHLRRRGVRWLVVGDDVRYRAMLLRLFGRRAEAEAIEPLLRRPCAPALLRWAYDRLACLNQTVPGFERIAALPITSSPSAMVRRLVVWRVRGLDDPQARLPVPVR